LARGRIILRGINPAQDGGGLRSFFRTGASPPLLFPPKYRSGEPAQCEFISGKAGPNHK